MVDLTTSVVVDQILPPAVVVKKRKNKVLFLYTGNSARSQMAEGFLRHLAGNKLVFSAGINPTQINPLAIKVMAEIGMDISGHKSKLVQEFFGKDFDFVISRCDDVKESCPYSVVEHIKFSVVLILFIKVTSFFILLKVTTS